MRRTQAERSAKSRETLLKAATLLIAREGVGAITFEALGRQGGVSRALPGLRFGSKAGLIEAVLKYTSKSHEAVVIQHGLDALPGIEAVLAYVDICLGAIGKSDEARAYFKLLSWSIGEAHETLPAFARAHDAARLRLRGWIDRGREEGVVGQDIDPAEASLVIASLVLGLSVQDLIDTDKTPSNTREAVSRAICTILDARRDPA